MKEYGENAGAYSPEQIIRDTGQVYTQAGGGMPGINAVRYSLLGAGLHVQDLIRAYWTTADPATWQQFVGLVTELAPDIAFSISSATEGIPQAGTVAAPPVVPVPPPAAPVAVPSPPVAVPAIFPEPAAGLAPAIPSPAPVPLAPAQVVQAASAIFAEAGGGAPGIQAVHDQAARAGIPWPDVVRSFEAVGGTALTTLQSALAQYGEPARAELLGGFPVWALAVAAVVGILALGVGGRRK